MGVWPEIADGTDINTCEVSGNLVPIRLNFGKQLSLYFEIFFLKNVCKILYISNGHKVSFFDGGTKKVKSSVYNFLGGPFQVSSVSYG
jgi:hypothetical protein